MKLLQHRSDWVVRVAVYLQTNLALLEMARGQYADAEPPLENCAELARALGETFLVAVNLGNLAIVVHSRGDSERAASLFEESSLSAIDQSLAALSGLSA